MEDVVKLSFSEELKYRICLPWSSKSYLLHFLLFIVLLGAGGVWYSIYNQEPEVAITTNIVTYFIAYISTSVAGIVNSNRIQNKKSFGYLFIFLLIISLLIGIIAASKANIYLAAFGALLSLLSWIISTADSPEYQEENIKTSIDKGQQKHGKGWENE